MAASVIRTAPAASAAAAPRPWVRALAISSRSECASWFDDGAGEGATGMVAHVTSSRVSLHQYASAGQGMDFIALSTGRGVWREGRYPRCPDQPLPAPPSPGRSRGGGLSPR